MKLYTDTIQFEEKKEVKELLAVCDKYKKQNPDDDVKALDRLKDCLEVLEMSW